MVELGIGQPQPGILPLPLVLFACNRSGILTLFEATEGTFGELPSQEMVGRSIFEVFRGLSEMLMFVRRALAGEPCTAMVTVATRTFQVHYVPQWEAPGVVNGLVGLAVDVTDRHRSTTTTSDDEAEFGALFEHVTDLVQSVDANGRFLYVNRAWQKAMGYDRASLATRTLFDVMATEAHELSRAFIKRALAGERVGPVETILLTLDGSRLALTGHLVPRRLGDRVVGWRGLWRPVSPTAGPIPGDLAMPIDAAALDAAPDIDPVTGLIGRRELLRRLEERLRRVTPPGTNLALLQIDLEDFRMVYQRYGPATGDRLLRMTAARLGQCVHPDDTVARLADDRFAVLLVNVDMQEDAIRVAEQVIGGHLEPIILAEDKVHLTTSVGIAIVEGPDVDANLVLQAAEAAMRRAKQLGKGRCVLASISRTDAPR